jgi:hypothetical protein
VVVVAAARLVVAEQLDHVGESESAVVLASHFLSENIPSG